jgi:outer membrane protein
MQSAVVLVLVGCVMIAPRAQSETLADALIGAYTHSGLLEQNRALLRAADEDVATAASALKPILNYSADISRRFGDSQQFPNVINDLGATTATASLIASLLLFDSGVATNQIEAAKETVLATRQQLISIEQQVLLRAVSAYMSVLANGENVLLRQNNQRLLEQELQAATDRFEVGEVTRTDVALAEARLAEARAGVATARGALQRAIEEYRNVIGRAPGALRTPPNLPQIDPNVETAKALALRSHPDLRAVQHQVAAAELGILAAEASQNPAVSAFGSLSLNENLGNSNFSQTGSVGIELSGPIYQGGAISSQIRRAIALRDAQRGNLHTVRHNIVQNVGNAYADLAALQASLTASEERIRAARVAFEGTREEATLGARTTLDVLTAEQELLDAETARISAQANLYVSAYQVLQSTGRLTTRDLQLPVQQYDPSAYYNLVKDAPTARSEQGRKLDRVLKSLQKQ